MSSLKLYNKKTEETFLIVGNNLILIGKILVIKSLVASHLTYILAPLATNQNASNEINNIFYSFLWNNKGDMIKRMVLINDYDKGGLKVIDLSLFNKLLKSKRIQKYLDIANQGNGKNLLNLKLEV